MKKCCIVGKRSKHRSVNIYRDINIKLVCNELEDSIISLIYDENVNYFMTSLEYISDIMATQIIINNRENASKVYIESMIAYERQADYWNITLRHKYYELASKCDYETLISSRYNSICVAIRDINMIRGSEYVIHICNDMNNEYNRLLRQISNDGHKKYIRIHCKY